MDSTLFSLPHLEGTCSSTHLPIGQIYDIANILSVCKYLENLRNQNCCRKARENRDTLELFLMLNSHMLIMEPSFTREKSRTISNIFDEKFLVFAN